MNEPVEYTLVKTVAGSPKKIKRKDPVILEDTLGNKLKAPWAPKQGCSKCFGRGFVGLDSSTNQLIPCRKCYPWKDLPKKL